VDAAGSAHLAGYTFSTNFPTAGAFQNTFGGRIFDAFVVKFNAAGSALVYSTYLGGNNNDVGNAVAVDSAGNVYLAGVTESANFPTVSPFQSARRGAYDAFITKLNAAGSAILYSSFLGGGAYDEAHGIAVDAAGSAYVTGITASGDFPTEGAFQATYAGGIEALVIRQVAAPPGGSTMNRALSRHEPRCAGSGEGRSPRGYGP
jgi:hypothetical protein